MLIVADTSSCEMEVAILPRSIASRHANATATVISANLLYLALTLNRVAALSIIQQGKFIKTSHFFVFVQK